MPVAAAESGSLCLSCEKHLRRPGQRWCRSCHAAWMRKSRRRHLELDDEQRRKANVRSYTNTLVARGQLIRGPCEVCGAAQVTAVHHPGYADPRDVRWRCREHRAIELGD